MDPFQVKRLKEEHQKGLLLCQEKINKWEKFKNDYEVLKQRLETLPDSLSYDVTVPFGNNAFTKGKIVHTNEIMVLLGDNWFAEVSAKQAVGIANRRVAQCINMLEDLNKEKKQYENWLSYIGELTNNEDLVEIVEDYDEEKEKLWKEQHTKNVKCYRQKLAQRKEIRSSTESDEDILSKLEELELADSNSTNDSNEEYFSKPSEKETEAFTNSTECSDDGSHSEEHPVKSGLRLNINRNHSRKTSESETGDDIDDHRKDIYTDAHDNGSPKNGKHVRWQDLTKLNSKKITFKHSKKQQNTPSCKYKARDSNEDENHPSIQSPSDIYKLFGNCLQSSPPKSILKVKTPSPSADFSEPIFPVNDMVSKESSPEIDENINSPFTGEVRECSSPINIENKSSRPTSHFKSSRKNRRR